MLPSLRAYLSLLPLLFFLVFYLGGSFALGDFYGIPISVAFLLTALLSVALSGGRFTKRIARFSAGAGEKNLMLMVWIYIMAGAFAASARAIGAVDATVLLTLRLLPASMIYIGLFLASAFISLAIGTSVGTIVALVPIAASIAPEIGEQVAVVVSVVVGGSYFGDNLSFISDTTIAATQTQGVRMADKFRKNLLIVLPAVLFMVVFCLCKGFMTADYSPEGEVDFVAVLPYIAVVVLSVSGLNVLVVLSVGILLSLVVALVYCRLPFFDFVGVVGDGVTSMGDLIIVALLAGGILELTKANGGIRLLMTVLQRNISSRRGAEASVALLVSLTNLCTANNTIAIITVGRIVRDISQRYALDARRVASLLDTFSCFVQGLIPYGVQMLIACNLSGCAPLEIIPTLYYPMAIGLSASLSILFNRSSPTN